jgi:hypothetical protein
MISAPPAFIWRGGSGSGAGALSGSGWGSGSGRARAPDGGLGQLRAAAGAEAGLDGLYAAAVGAAALAPERVDFLAHGFALLLQFRDLLAEHVGRFVGAARSAHGIVGLADLQKELLDLGLPGGDAAVEPRDLGGLRGFLAHAFGHFGHALSETLK